MKKLLFYLFIISGIFLTACNNNAQQKNGSTDEILSLEEGQWKMGIALYSFHRHPFHKAIDMADRAPVDYVEGFSFYQLGSAFQDSTMGNMDSEGIILMKKILDERGMKMSSMYVDGAKNVNDWKRYFDIGSGLNVEYLVCEPPKEHWDIIDSLAGVYSIDIAIHEHAKGESAYWHPDSVLAAMEGRPNIGACADLGHWARSGLDPVECLKKLEGKIIGIHLKDVAEFGNIKAKDVNPGTGVIDFNGVVKELQRQRFNGFVHVECEHNLDNNLDDVREAINYFNDLGSVKTNIERISLD